MKKGLKIAGITLLLFLMLLLLLPYLFREKLLIAAKATLNENLEATVDFKDLDVSFLHRFPRVSVQLQGLSIVGKDAFAGDTLLSAKTTDVAVSLFSLFGKEPSIQDIDISSPRIHARVNKNGQANWDIIKNDTIATTAADSTGGFQLQLERYGIHDAYLLYEDELAGMRAELSGLEHEGSGNLGAERFTLSTKTSTGGASFSYAHIPYLAGTAVSIDADVDIDLATATYRFDKTKLVLNALTLTTDGSVQLLNDSSYALDLRFAAPSADFKEFLSLVPALYRTDFDRLKTSGKAAFSGWAKGVYSPSSLPAYDIKAHVEGGSFQYPDLPQPVKNIVLNLHAHNPDGVADHSTFELLKGHLEMAGEPFDIRFIFRTPISAPYVDGAAKGGLNLADLSQFIKLERGTKLGGRVKVDAFIKGALSALQGDGGPFAAGGFLRLTNLSYSKPSAFPQPLRNGRLNVALTNNNGNPDGTIITLSDGHAEVGANGLDFSGQVQRPFSEALFSGSAKGRFDLGTLKQFVSLENGTQLTGLLQADMQFKGSKAAIDKGAYETLHFSGTTALQNASYISKDYPTGITLTTLRAVLSPQVATISSLQGKYRGTTFAASGTLKNIVAYALQNGILQGNLAVSLDRLNGNDWMGTPSATATSATAAAPFAIPADLDLTLRAKAGEVAYDKVVYKNIDGTILLNNETAKLQDVKTEALDGTIAFSGTYSTRLSKATPDISLTYDVSGVDVQKAFYAYNTVQRLMPAGRFLAGRLSSQLALKGRLGIDLFPELSSLTGGGNLLLLEGVLKKFAPLDKIASTLNINDLKEVSLKEMRSFFEFANGKVLVKPFNVKVKDIDMQVGGLHGFDQSLSYLVQLKVPRRYLGAGGNSLVNGLATAAAKKGVPVIVGETVNLTIRLGGTLTAPTISTDLKEAAGDATKDLQAQVVAFAKNKADSARQAVRDTLSVIKKGVVEDLKEGLRKTITGNKDSAGNRRPDSTTKKVGDRLKGAFNNMLKRKTAPRDTTRQ